jgi:3-hexulose-6-phosphate synthase/6-phospho-3-hexuloisomerase
VKTVVQISLDVTDLQEAIATAEMALRAGVDWLEAGTPLILAEGLRAVRELRARFPEVPIVADLKTMDGGYLEAEMMGKAGKDYNVGVMGDNLGCPDMVAGAKWLQDLGCDYVIHHIGYDERRGIAARGEKAPTPLDQLKEVVDAVTVPVQAVGGLSIQQAIDTPKYGAPLVVIGAPLAIDADRFQRAGGDLEEVLRQICQAVHNYGDVPVGKK